MLFNIIIVLYHLLEGLLKLKLFLLIEVLACLFQLAHLRFHLVQDEAHLIFLLIMLLSYYYETLFKLNLIPQI